MFCDIDYAIRAHSFSQRVAAVTQEFANNAVRVALTHFFVESDDTGKIGLSVNLQGERNALAQIAAAHEFTSVTAFIDDHAVRWRWNLPASSFLMRLMLTLNPHALPVCLTF